MIAFSLLFCNPDVRFLQFFDVGFAECSETTAVTTTITAVGEIPTPDPMSDIAFNNGFCMVAPYVTNTACK